jgi:poly-gamma-glutamate synthesis protein (capsule biosynthesis protein)
MEREGNTYPARDIGEWLRNADLTHINNVLSFASGFPYPDPTDQFQRFCSDPSYIVLLEDIGTDIVEVTGHRLADWVLEAIGYTIDLYQEDGLNYYGGGYNLMDARDPRIVEHNGNRLVFVGCDAKGGGYATASETQPGAAACEFDWLLPEVTRLRDEGYLVIITFQHEEDYSFTVRPELVADFQSVAAPGAVIVSGSQAHNPQGMEFYEGSFLHFGFGILFFDQYNYCAEQICNYTIIDRHVFYDGRNIANELLTAQFEDYARSRPMTLNEREELLNRVFEASGW